MIPEPRAGTNTHHSKPRASGDDPYQQERAQELNR